MKAKDAFGIVFQVIVTAAALKAALTTLSRPMGGTPHQPATARLGRFGSVGLEGYDDDDLDGLDYEDLLQ